MTAANTAPTVLIADDEPLLARVLQAELGALWPEAQTIATVHDGMAAVEAVRQHRPGIAFLDIRMPGLSGMEVARELRAMPSPPLVVFVTAYDQFAVEAFEQAAVDYVLKPIQRERLEGTVQRLKARLATQAPSADNAAARLERIAQLLERLAGLEGVDANPPRAGNGQYLRFIKALVGQEVRIIPVDEVIYLEATDKYVNVVSANGEALIRTSLRELTQRLDPDRFWQIHRGTVVNIDCVASAVNHSLGRLALKLRNRPETLPVARQYAHLFKQM
ncbi:LytTR family DNA-binding domain-containing protein [Cupriavidus sp. AU9028]|uniref:LytR/AlgR family response regulator transcription factor n=1 Tax=Cupriavidus sp. AU9028 TaxID=2871157 RepID=UPI001C9807EC|nr:LytTR family DNA-binding domain-containing protein [Cupriavidus sp. AU9028]MBY4898032.1 LytTR family DNA-binding domain-containing protein [Cupriavidus sp. AU9028]